MKTFMTTAAIVAALSFPAFAEGDDPSAKAGDARGTVTAPEADRTGASPSAGQGSMSRSTTGAGSATTNKLTPDEAQKSTTGADSGSSGASGGAGGGSGGAGGGGGGGGGGGNR
jgi:hypothetical protein